MKVSGLLLILLTTKLQTESLAIDAQQCENLINLTLSNNLAPEGRKRITPIRGIGASFPNALYQAAALAYNLFHPTTRVSYFPSGSGKGKCRIMDYCEKCDSSDTFQPANPDFVGSDSLLKSEDYLAYPDMQMYPACAGAVVPIFNLRNYGIRSLVLDRQTLSQIFRRCDNCTLANISSHEGSIHRWDDPKIVALNPEVSKTKLSEAGEITVFVRGSKSGTTEIFKKALSKFEQTFNDQIGTSSSATWNNAKVVKVESSSAIEGLVLSTPGSISYTVFSSLLEIELDDIKILKEPNTQPVRVSKQSTSFAMMELGLQFGNNGDDESRLTADLVDTKGPNSWPISAYTYFVLRKNTTRLGGDCVSRQETLNYLRWFYYSDAVAEIAASKGFVTLPGEVRDSVFSKLENDIKCDDSTLTPDTGTLDYEIKVNKELVTAISELESVYRIRKMNFKLLHNPTDPEVDDVTKYHNPGKPLLRIGFKEHILADNIANNKTFYSTPLVSVDYGFAFNLCGTQSCEYSSVQVHMTPKTAGQILDGHITRWDNPGIIMLDADGNEVSKPAQDIKIFRPEDANDLEWEEKFTQQMKQHKSCFNYDLPGEIRFDFNEIRQLMLSVEYGFAMIPITRNPGKLKFVGMKLNDGSSAFPSTSPDSRYPFKQELYAMFPTTFTGVECHQDDSGVEIIAIEFAKFLEWFLDPTVHGNYFQDKHMTPLIDIENISGKVAAEHISCDEYSVLRPFHDITVVSDSFILLVRSAMIIALAFCFLLAIWIFRYRAEAHMKASTYTFLLQIVLGCSITLSTLIPLLWDDRVLYEGSDISPPDEEETYARLNFGCRLIPFTFFGGLMLTFAPLLLKTWRVVRIFQQKKLKKLNITNKMLLRLEIIVLGFFLSILVLWLLLDPLRWEREITMSDTLTGKPVKSIGRCISDKPLQFLLPAAAILISVLVYGNYLSFRAREVPSKFSEGVWIAISLNNFLECIILTVPIMVYAVDNPVLDTTIKSMLIIVGSLGTLLAIFLPKIFYHISIGRIDTKSTNSTNGHGYTASKDTKTYNKSTVIVTGSATVVPVQETG